MVLMGFAHIFREMNSSAFVIGRLDRGGKQSWETGPAMTIPKELSPFSDPEATVNAEKFDRLREWYNSHCPCDAKHCPFMDSHLILPEVTDAILSSIQSNETKSINEMDATTATQEQRGGGTNPEAEVIQLLDNDALWNESSIERCPYVILDLGSNRGDTLQSYLNILLSSVYSPSPLSPFHSSHHQCVNRTEQNSYHFDLQSLSVQHRTAEELSKRHDRLHKHHQLDMETYLDLHVGRIDGEADPWMAFQLRERMEKTQQKGEEQSKMLAMKQIYEEQLRRNDGLERKRPRPEEYCFYGVEGNPSFTRTLRGLELVVMGGGEGDNKPGEHRVFQKATNVRRRLPAFAEGLRALRHIHFFTGTVVTSRNGLTDLYIDSTSADHVGSSLLESHKYATMGGKEKVQVQGVTLTWLLQSVLSGFGADAGRKGDGHLILKIDIEGGEYGVLKEALESGLLCDYASERGNRVDLAVEFHKWVIEDKKVSRLV